MKLQDFLQKYTKQLSITQIENIIEVPENTLQRCKRGAEIKNQYHRGKAAMFFEDLKSDIELMLKEEVKTIPPYAKQRKIQ
jgi:hypothetical protein